MLICKFAVDVVSAVNNVEGLMLTLDGRELFKKKIKRTESTVKVYKFYFMSENALISISFRLSDKTILYKRPHFSFSNFCFIAENRLRQKVHRLVTRATPGVTISTRTERNEEVLNQNSTEKEHRVGHVEKQNFYKIVSFCFVFSVYFFYGICCITVKTALPEAH